MRIIGGSFNEVGSVKVRIPLNDKQITFRRLFRSLSTDSFKVSLIPVGTRFFLPVNERQSRMLFSFGYHIL